MQHGGLGPVSVLRLAFQLDSLATELPTPVVVVVVVVVVVASLRDVLEFKVNVTVRF